MGWNEDGFNVEGIGYVRCTHKNITSGGRDEYAFHLVLTTEVLAEGQCECHGTNPCRHKLQALDDRLREWCAALKEARKARGVEAEPATAMECKFPAAKMTKAERESLNLDSGHVGLLVEDIETGEEWIYGGLDAGWQGPLGSLTRYTAYDSALGTGPDFEKLDDGNWVDFEEAEALLAARDKAIEELREDNRQLELQVASERVAKESRNAEVARLNDIIEDLKRAKGQSLC